MKKALSLLLALCLTGAALSGCGGSSSASSAPASSQPASSAAAPSESAPASQPEAAGPTPEKPITLKFGNSSAPDKLGSVVMEKFCANVTERTTGAVVCEW